MLITSETSLNAVRRAIDHGISEIELNHCGGPLDDGIAIADLIASNKIDIVIKDLVAGSGVLIAVSGRTVKMDRLGFMGFIKPFIVGQEDNQLVAELIDDSQEHFIKSISERRNVERKLIEKLIQDESMIDASYALKIGLIDEIVD